MDPSTSPVVKRDRSSLVVLVAANLLPLAGVLWWGWKVSNLVFVYWIENVVIGVFNVARMLIARENDSADHGAVIGVLAFGLRLGTVAFFIVHYGGFCFGHGVFLAALFPPGGNDADRELDEVLLQLLRDPYIVAAALVLFASHGYSFVHHFVRGKEYLVANVDELMGRPYKRILVVHAFILAGGFAATYLQSQLPALLVFIALKVALDGWSHLRERRRAPATA